MLDPGLLLVGWLLLSKRRPRPSTAAPAPAAAALDPNMLHVFIASMADDAPDVVRVFGGRGSDTKIQLIGIFQTEANARAAIASEGWELVMPEVQQLKVAP